MKRQELKSIIRECLDSVLTERVQDPTREEMLQFLRQQFGGGEEGFEDAAEVAMYWFANHYHGGQWSNLYSVLSTSQFSPGPISRGPEPESLESDMYQALEAEYGGKEHQHGEEDMLQETPVILPYLDNNFFILTPKQAQEFSVDGQLPRPGYEKRADTSKLKGIMGDFNHHVEPIEMDDTTTGWILQTVSNGKPLWALRLHSKMGGMKEMTGTGAVQGYMAPMGLKGPVPAKSAKHPKDVPAHRMNEVGWNDEESYKRSHGDTFNPEDEEALKKSFADAERTYQKDDADALYVQYDSERQGEEPFMMNGQKFQYVNAIYPSGKKDIGVYAFAGDMVYGYEAFRQRMGLKEAELVDPTTGDMAPGPRDRFEMQPGGAAKKDVPEKEETYDVPTLRMPNTGRVGGLMSVKYFPDHVEVNQWQSLGINRGTEARPQKIPMALFKQHLEPMLKKLKLVDTQFFDPATGKVNKRIREQITPIRLKNLIKVV